MHLGMRSYSGLKSAGMLKEERVSRSVGRCAAGRHKEVDSYTLMDALKMKED